MLNRPAWFTREFAFKLPTWMFPNVVGRLRGTPARLEDLVRGTPAELLMRRDGDRWSIQEHAGHLLDLSELDTARLGEFETGARVLTAADRENRQTHEANHNAAAIGVILAAFRADRHALCARLERLDEASIARAALHPRLQTEMRLIDWTFFVAEHDDHHLASISGLLRLWRQAADD
ncbi:MAG: DinB family protein [Pyrinomonadaceae bacterium]